MGILRAVFSDWQTLPAEIRISFRTKSDGAGSLYLDLRDGTEALDPEGKVIRREEVFLSAEVRFQVLAEALEGRMLSFYGRAVNDHKRAALRRVIDAHREWSNAEVEKAVVGAGVKYGPGKQREILALLNRVDLRPMFGKVATGKVETFEFVSRESDIYDGGRGDAVAEWVVVRRSGNETLRLRFDPFEGRLCSALATTDPRSR